MQTQRSCWSLCMTHLPAPWRASPQPHLGQSLRQWPLANTYRGLWFRTFEMTSLHWNNDSSLSANGRWVTATQCVQKSSHRRAQHLHAEGRSQLGAREPLGQSLHFPPCFVWVSLFIPALFLVCHEPAQGCLEVASIDWFLWILGRAAISFIT